MKLPKKIFKAVSIFFRNSYRELGGVAERSLTLAERSRANGSVVVDPVVERHDLIAQPQRSLTILIRQRTDLRAVLDAWKERENDDGKANLEK